MWNMSVEYVLTNDHQHITVAPLYQGFEPNHAGKEYQSAGCRKMSS